MTMITFGEHVVLRFQKMDNIFPLNNLEQGIGENSLEKNIENNNFDVDEHGNIFMQPLEPTSILRCWVFLKRNWIETKEKSTWSKTLMTYYMNERRIGFWLKGLWFMWIETFPLDFSIFMMNIVCIFDIGQYTN